jgi:hypothetical protein
MVNQSSRVRAGVTAAQRPNSRTPGVLRDSACKPTARVRQQETVQPISIRRASFALSIALLFSCGALVNAAPGEESSSSLAAVTRAVDDGRFREAESQISRVLSDTNLDPEERAAFEFQRERMRRILLDFTLTGEEVRSQLARQIPDLTTEQFEAWDSASLLECQVIDGRKLYFNRAPSNLFRLSADAAARRV